MDKKYSIGLDIGTSSIGFVGVDENGWPLNIKGKRAIGAHLFREGEAAAETRGFRTTRRRYNRRKWRLRLLREIFDEPISRVDPTFFARMKESSVSPKDPNYDGLAKEILIPRDKDGKILYPTIYHLRHALMYEDHQFDIREIYLAIHHIVKYRGHFLLDGAAKNFESSNLDLKSDIHEINAILVGIFGNEQVQFNDQYVEKLKEVLLDSTQSRSDRQKAAAKLLLPTNDLDKDTTKILKTVSTEITKAITGLKAKFFVITGNDIAKDQQKDWTFSIDTLDEKMSVIEPSFSEKNFSLITILQKLYSSVTLAGIVPNGLSLSEAMIQKYDRHASDLVLLKKYWDTKPKVLKHQLQNTYAEYIEIHQVVDEFYSDLSKLIKNDDDTLAQEIKSKITIGNFLPKQRTTENGVIPYQLQQRELDTIIKNQQEYYPWLAEENPVADHQIAFPYKLDELVGFRIPYYVGPMIAKEDTSNSKNSKFAWMIRKQSGEVTPWNFDEKIDRTASATAFIDRMTTTDTYLIGEDVLPKQSLIYQRFEVLNELNKISIDGQPITRKQKQSVYTHVFEKKKTVQVKDVQKFLVSSGEVMSLPKIGGLANEKQFNSSLSTLYDYNKIIPDALEDRNKVDDIEKIILWSTIFEDNSIFVEKLDSIDWLTSSQRKRLAQKRYRGWGRLSLRLLTTFKNKDGYSILDELWNSNHNFMEIQAQSDFSEQIATANNNNLSQVLPAKWEPGRKNLASLDEFISNLYTSPQNKKALRKAIRVVQDMMTAAGHMPEKIFIEVARDTSNSHQQTIARQRQLQQLYQSEDKEVIDSSVRSELDDILKNRANIKDQLFLYFQQGGRDLYTGKAINIDKLSLYHIDHILPQSLVKDDSLDNRVLVSQKTNEDKGVTFVSDKYMNNMLPTWKRWHEMGLISARKLKNLTMRPDEIDKYAPGFIQRQLVETRQVTKLVIELLDALLGNSQTEIITIKASLSHQFRQQFDLVKIREVNDNHHAFDAFLAARIGTYLYKRYPKLRPYFVYGQYMQNHKNLKSINLIKTLDSDKAIVDEGTGEILWDKKSDLAKMIKIYNYQRLLITHESRTSFGAMYKQKILKATDAKQNGGGFKLVPTKRNRPVDIYGGYTGQTAAYLTIVRVYSKKTSELRVLPIYTNKVQQIEKAMTQGDKATMLAFKKVIAPQLGKENKKTHEIKIPEFDVVIPKVLLDQLVIDDIAGSPHRFRLGTDTYYHNSQQLFLPLSMQRQLMDRESDDKVYLDIFNDVLKQVDSYFNLYDVNGFRAALQKSKKAFEQLPINDFPKDVPDNKKKKGKRSILKEIFIGLHANATLGNLKQMGIKTDFGKLQKSNGLRITENCKIIHQSPTGLFERIVPIK